MFQRQPSEITHVVQWSEGIFANVSHLSSAILKTNIELTCERVLGFYSFFGRTPHGRYICWNIRQLPCAFYDVCDFVSNLTATDRQQFARLKWTRLRWDKRNPTEMVKYHGIFPRVTQIYMGRNINLLWYFFYQFQLYLFMNKLFLLQVISNDTVITHKMI